jgi:uridylate kinase
MSRSYALPMKTTVISLGGSIIIPEKVDIAFLREFRKLILNHVSKGHRFVIVCGGGKVCREYQAAAQQVTKVSNEDLDWIGILSTKLNAELVRSIFGDKAYDIVINNPGDRIRTNKKIILAAGYLPGSSSDKDAILMAKTFGAKEVINMSNIDQVYTSDPRKDKHAKPLSHLTWKRFLSITGDSWVPGKNVPFDPVASKLARRSGIKVIIMGKDLKNFKKCLDKKPFLGTTIT